MYTCHYAHVDDCTVRLALQRALACLFHVKGIWLLGMVEGATRHHHLRAARRHAGDSVPRTGKISELFVYDNFSRVPAERVEAGDICAFAGLSDASIGETINNPASPAPLPTIAVRPHAQLPARCLPSRLPLGCGMCSLWSRASSLWLLALMCALSWQQPGRACLQGTAKRSAASTLSIVRPGPAWRPCST